MWRRSRRRLLFPPASWASPEGVIAVGGRPDAETLKEAYSRGIFPWPHDGVPLLWFCPDPRFVLVPAQAHVSRSLRKEMRQGTFEVRADTAFSEVIGRCSQKPRPGQGGTWITQEMIAGYTALHCEGLAHSIEAWRDGKLVGGLYGISLGSVFFGESMFADAANASKVAFATLLANLLRWGFPLVDCQSYTGHLESFGAEEWPRARFLALLKRSLAAPTRQGPWTLDLGPIEAAAALAGGEAPTFPAKDLS
ncbi:MAG TPA: leucyl/phenylalanyl-tRNA--protein transferase [Thermoanaerobaculia bacterium]|nr:leucyl/phenylalanyl-tRNA--protein transferase [Thermoanaerobaculia bacterium]